MARYLDLSIPRKIVVAFAALVFIFLGASTATYLCFAAMDSAADKNEASQVVSHHGRQLLFTMIEQQNAVRGFITTGDETFLDTFDKNVDAFEHSAQEFTRLTKLPEQKRRAEDLKAAVAEWHALQVKPQIALGRDPSTRPQAHAMTGKLKLTKVRTLADQINRVQENAIAQREAEQETAATVGSTVLALSALLAALSAVGFGLLLSRLIAKPISQMTETMRELAAGNNGIAIPGADRRDEIGEMASAVTVFRDTAMAKQKSDAAQAQAVAQVADGLAAVAQGDLTKRLNDLPADYTRLEKDFNAAIAALGVALEAVATGSRTIDTTAGEISCAADDLAHRTTEQAANLEETAAAVHEITSTVNQTAAGTAQAESTVRETRRDVEQGGAVVKRAISAMDEIEESSAEIGNILTLIDGIAFQTNLLALNAGVEAARAGEAGKGFAVVAAEVRTLALRSAEAASEIKAKIEKSAGHVKAGSTLVAETGEALLRISERVGQIDELIAGINQSATRQSAALEQVNAAVGSMNIATQQNAAMVEESTAAARSMSEEAQVLNREISRFRLPARGAKPSPRYSTGSYAAAA